MANAWLEHANITVSDPEKTALWMGNVFGWHIRWSGEAINGGRTIHVGADDNYLAIYAPPGMTSAPESSYIVRGGLNHIGVVVDDLDATEERIKAEGFETTSHADYEPGRRFYFDDHDGIEFEVVSYTT